MKILRFDEKNLTLQDLDKSINGLGRGNVLIKKLQDEDKFSFKPPHEAPKIMPIENGEEIVSNISDEDGEYDSEMSKDFFKNGLRYTPVIQAADGEEYRLNDLEKTIEFGSSGGASLGSKGTREVECLQCLFLALRQTKGRDIKEGDINDLWDENGMIKNTYLEQIRVPLEFTDEIIETYFENEKWMSTFLNVSNGMYSIEPVYTKGRNHYEKALSKRKKYIFYHIGWDKSITDALAKQYKKLENSGIPIAKWTPSDVWAVSMDQEDSVLTEIYKCETFTELNRLINSLFTANLLRGISLKKVSGIKDDMTIIINKLTPVPEYKFNGVVVSSNPFSSIGLRILANRESKYMEDGIDTIDLRSFSGPTTPSDISGEVLGNSARHGKVGLWWINRVIDNINSEYDFGEPIPNITLKEDITESDEELRLEITRLKDLIVSYGATETRNGADRVSTRPQLLSKYQALKVAEILYKYSETRTSGGKSVSDILIEDMFYYAMSIKNDVFECPKYIRMI
jgi:hypothetical protein